MFFSKIFFPVVAILGVATSAFASPVAPPVNELVERATTVTSDLQTFKNTVTPMINSFSGSSADVNALATVFADITAKINVDVFVSADISVVLDLALSIIVDLLVKLDINIDINISAKIDVFLSAFIGALDKKHSGLAKSIGAGIPVIDLNIFVLLDLVLSAKVLVLIDILGIIIL
ncbi:hypothetical protein C8Q75DRAFT_803734 [Abortiporus biennis]|nr:hypothetical protein C8Q75DRAFT_803734 [Abortiporus biennis]